VLAFTASATVPDSGYRYMTGNTGYWFVGYFCTDSLSNVVVHVQNDLEFRYVAAPAVVTGGSAMVATPFTVTPFVPYLATSFTCYMQINATVAGRYADIFDSSGASPQRLVDNGTIQCDRTVEFNQIAVPGIGYNGVIAYGVSNAATTLSVAVLGFKL